LRQGILEALARKGESAEGVNVVVRSGAFEVFRGLELRVECLLASAALPTLFPAVSVPGRGVYWDGLFSQNPPNGEAEARRFLEQRRPAPVPTP
jgi:hypothetical protein